MGFTINFIGTYIKIFSEHRITQAAAALSYYLSMTFFPLLLVVYSIIAHEPQLMFELLELCDRFLEDGIIDFIREYVLYVDSGNYGIILPLGLTTFLTYSSAALRTLYKTIGALQGGTEYRGVSFYIVSFIYSILFVAAIYFSLTILLIGRGAVMMLASVLAVPYYIFLYTALEIILFFMLIGLYHLPKRKNDSYSVVPGSIFVSISTMLITPLFSMFIGKSARYPLIYGSMASFVMLMLWLYLCCLLLCSGAVLNICVYRNK